MSKQKEFQNIRSFFLEGLNAEQNKTFEDEFKKSDTFREKVQLYLSIEQNKHFWELKREDLLIEKYIKDKNALTKIEKEQFYYLYNNDVLFKKRVERQLIPGASDKEKANKISKVLSISFYKVTTIAASILILLSLSFYFLSIKPAMKKQLISYDEKIEQKKAEQLILKNKLEEKAVAIEQLKDENAEINERLLEKETGNLKLAQQLTHYKKRIASGAFYYNDSYAYNTKGENEHAVIIAPIKNQQIRKGMSISFKWHPDQQIYELAIYDNKDNKLERFAIKNDSTLTFSKELDFGTYYWKLKYSNRKPAKVGWFQIHF